MNYRLMIAERIKPEGFDTEAVYKLITVPPDRKLGDYALPCFSFAKALRQSPVKIANDIASGFEIVSPFKKVEAVNGYVNFFLDSLELAKSTLNEIIKAENAYGDSADGEGKTICIDYSSINIAKPFHIGHLLTTVIGGALYRLYKKLGYNVVGINHLGDWGTQFGKLISAFKRWGSEETLKKEGMPHLTRLYVRFHEEAKQNPALEDEGRYYFKKIEDGDEEALRLFAVFKDITLKEVEKTYKRLNIKFDSYNGEAFYNDKMQPILDELEEKGLLKESEGAKVVDLSEYNMPPCLLVKADGATLYATRDLAAAYYRKKTYDFYKCLYVVAYQQNLHFRQWFKVLELLGKDWDVEHIPFGMVSLEDGAMSTRTGNVVLLEDVLNKAAEKALAIIKEKNPDLEDKEEIAEQVGVGAVVFSALYNNRIKDIVFSYDKVLSFEGETAPYVQYTNARCGSVLEKAGEIELGGELDYEGLNNPEAEYLVKLLEKFPETLVEAAEKKEPCNISRLLVNICQAFNKFYYEHRILNEEKHRAVRLMLVKAVKIVLEEGLRILGIGAPRKM